MSLKTLLHHLVRSQSRRLSSARRRTARWDSLRFERLEERTVLAEIAVFGGNIGLIPPTPLPPEIFDESTSFSAVDQTDFGGVPVDSGSKIYTYSIRNLTIGSLSLGSNAVSIVGRDGAFTVTQQPATTVGNPILGTPQRTTFNIKFDPPAGGTFTATVNINSNDANENPFNFQVQGVGGSPDIKVFVGAEEIADGDTSSLPIDHTNFGMADLTDQSLTKTFTIRNDGERTLEVGEIAITPATLFGFPRAGRWRFHRDYAPGRSLARSRREHDVRRPVRSQPAVARSDESQPAQSRRHL